MSKTGKSVLAWILALAMVLTMGNTSVLAQTAQEAAGESNALAVVSDGSVETESVETVVSDTVSDDETASASVMSTSTATSAETYFESQLEAALESFSTEFSLDSSYGITADEYKKMYSDYLYHHYTYFYVDPAAYSWDTTTDGAVVKAYITYELDGDELDVSQTSVQTELQSKVEALEAVIDEVTDAADSSWSDLEKALYVHDYLAMNCEYDLSYAKDTVYNALVEGSAVCEGYASAFLTLTEALGLSCEVVSIDCYEEDSNGNESGHMWNLVEIDGNWYHVDVTWDDPIYSGASANDSLGTDVIGRVEHYFFLKSTNYFLDTEISGSQHLDIKGGSYEYSGTHTDDDASDTIYDDYFWDDVDASFEYVDGTWYGLTRVTDSSSSSKVNAVISTYTYNSSKKSFQEKDTVLTVSQYWYVPGSTSSFLVGNFSYLASYDGWLYYNTNDTIYAYDPEEGEIQTAYTLSDTEAAEGFIYGFCIDTDGNVNYLLEGYSSGLLGRIGVYTAFSVKNYIGKDYEIVLSETSYTYDGTAKTPTVTVVSTTDSSVTLTEETDYTVSYSNNTNAGTATVTVTGKGNYAGTLTEEFTIEKADRYLTLTNTATGEDISGGSVTLKYADYLYIQAAASAGDGTFSFSNSTSNAVFTAKSSSAGTCTVQAQAYSGTSVITITVASTDNYNSVSANVTVTCAKLTQTLTATDVSLTYGGSSVQINPTHSSTGGTITYSCSDTSVATVGSSTGIVKPIGAGTATITITAAATDTYAQAVTTITVTVAKATQTVTLSKTSLSVNMGSTVTISASTNGDGTLKYSSADTSIATVSSAGKITPKGVGTVKITVYAAAGSNYSKSSSKTVTVTVGLKTPTISSVKQSNKTTTITWGKVTGASGYYVYRSTSSSSVGSKIATVTSGVSYKDTASKTNGTTYYYRVYAYSGSTKSSASSVKSIKYMKGTVSSLTNTSSGVKVKWSKVSGATGYYIWRKAGSGSYSKVKTITSASTVSWTDGSAANGTTYTYYVQPYNKTSTGAYAAKTTVRLTAVSLSSVKNSASKKMTVKWAKNSKATGYQIQYSTSSSFASGNKTVTVSGASSVSKVISSLTKGKTYYVRIRVYKTVSGTKYYSAWSSKKSVKISK